VLDEHLHTSHVTFENESQQTHTPKPSVNTSQTVFARDYPRHHHKSYHTYNGSRTYKTRAHCIENPPQHRQYLRVTFWCTAWVMSHVYRVNTYNTRPTSVENQIHHTQYLRASTYCSESYHTYKGSQVQIMSHMCWVMPHIHITNWSPWKNIEDIKGHMYKSCNIYIELCRTYTSRTNLKERPAQSSKPPRSIGANSHVTAIHVSCHKCTKSCHKCKTRWHCIERSSRTSGSLRISGA